MSESYDKLDNKRTASVVVAKGCVARCTFCHRFEKGYRVRPVLDVIEHIKDLKNNYNVGYLSIADENFGSNKTLTKQLVKYLGSTGIKWRAGGVRAYTVDLETLKFWKQNGCEMVIYGMESGSPTMLKVMEKKVTLEQNINALKWAYEADLATVIQLVIGMPGETDKTIQETIDFLKKTWPYYSDCFRDKITVVVSPNYAQSLPGTPLYEYARKNKLPLLGICRGMQMMGVCAGIKLKKIKGHVNTFHKLSGSINRVVNSYHKYSLAKCPVDYKVIASSEDNEIEAIRHNDLCWEGWMWHPERKNKFDLKDMKRIKDLFEN